MKIIKKVILIGVLLMSMTNAVNAEMTININGKESILPEETKIVNDSTFVPLRKMLNSMNMDVAWNEEEKKIYVNDAVNMATLHLNSYNSVRQYGQYTYYCISYFGLGKGGVFRTNGKITECIVEGKISFSGFHDNLLLYSIGLSKGTYAVNMENGEIITDMEKNELISNLPTLCYGGKYYGYLGNKIRRHKIDKGKIVVDTLIESQTPIDVYLSNERIYYCDCESRNIMSCDLSGNDVRVVSEFGEMNPDRFVVIGDTMYILNHTGEAWGTFEICALDIPTGEVDVIVKFAREFNMDHNHIYYSDDKAIYRCSYDGSGVEKIADEPGIMLALSDEYVYFTGYGSEASYYRVLKTGGKVEDLTEQLFSN